MTTSAFLAHSGIWNADEAVIAKVKLASLLHDNVLHSGPFDPVLFAEATARMQDEPDLTEGTRSAIGACWSKLSPEVPQFEIYGNEAWQSFEHSPQSLKRSTTAALLAHGLSPREHYDDWKLHLYTILEIQYWRKHVPPSTFIGHGVSDMALERLAAPLIEVEGVQEVVSPDSGAFELTWNDIFDLRRSTFLTQFRCEHARLAALGESARLREHYLQALEHLADEVRPSTKRAVGLAVLSNLPIPFVNPFHVGHSIYEVWHQSKLGRQFGWVMFIREAKRLASRDSKDG